MQLKHLKSFVAVADTLHFRRAAAALGVTQPALSAHIMKLERDVGARLLERGRRHVELTAAGQALLEGSRAPLVGLEGAAQAARELGEARRNTVVVGQVEYLSPAYMPAALKALKASFPRAVVETRELVPREALQALRAGSVDVAVTVSLGAGDARGRERVEDLVVRKVRRGQIRVVLSRHHALARLNEVPLSALAEEELILFQRRINPPTYDWLIARCHEAGFTPRVTHHVSQPHHGPALAAQGVGVFLISSYLLDKLPRNAVSRPLAGFPATITLSAVWRPGACGPLLKAFLSGLPSVSR